jgi:hypothetical protein
MEILRFEDSTSPAPKRKKSSKGYITLGFVAAVFGIGSAFATTTVEINSGDGISLGQGVTLAAACDTDIDIVPITAMTVETPGGPTFYLTELQINGIGARETNLDAVPDPITGCGGQVFDVQIFDTATPTTAYGCGVLVPLGANPLKIYEGSVEVANLRTITCESSTLSFPIATALDGVDRNYKIVFGKAPSDISYITLVSRES